MRKLEFDHGWRFHAGELADGMWRGELDDSDWRPVDLPHDWSIELERGLNEGARLAGTLADYVRSVDPTRPVTAGVNGSHTGWPWEQLDAFLAALDVCGYNYAEDKYRADHERVLDRVVYGWESMALDASRHWASVLELDHVIGDFVWTALDYLGESGIGRVHFDGDLAPYGAPYPWHQANCGDFDLCGFKRPQSFHRDAVWKRGRPLFIAAHAPVDAGLTPVVTPWGWPDVWPIWTWPGNEGRLFLVDVYTSGDVVELFLDGESLGTSRAEHCTAMFEVPYRPGTLRATGADGLVHPNAGHTVSFTVAGEGTIAAVGSGDPASTEAYAGDRRSAYHGRCLVVLKSSGARGEIRLRAEASGLAVAETTVGVA
jgi:beta-galactosidase